MSDERRRARERAAAQDASACAVWGRERCRLEGCDVRARLVRDDGGAPWLQVELGTWHDGSPARVFDFFLVIDEPASEWAVRLNADAGFWGRGYVAYPDMSLHGLLCPRCGQPAPPVKVEDWPGAVAIGDDGQPGDQPIPLPRTPQ